MNMHRRILTQGDFDGLCLLYSLLNGYKALTDTRSTASAFFRRYVNAWNRIVGVVPSLQNFVSTEGAEFGALTAEAHTTIQFGLVDSVLSILGEKRKIRVEVERVSVEKAKGNRFQNSVLVLCLTEKTRLGKGSSGEHWVAIVGKDPPKSQYLIACSATHLECHFSESVDSKSGRTFNNTMGFEMMSKGRVYENVYRLFVRA